MNPLERFLIDKIRSLKKSMVSDNAQFSGFSNCLEAVTNTEIE